MAEGGRGQAGSATEADENCCAIDQATVGEFKKLGRRESGNFLPSQGHAPFKLVTGLNRGAHRTGGPKTGAGRLSGFLPLEVFGFHDCPIRDGEGPGAARYQVAAFLSGGDIFRGEAEGEELRLRGGDGSGGRVQ